MFVTPVVTQHTSYIFVETKYQAIEQIKALVKTFLSFVSITILKTFIFKNRVQHSLFQPTTRVTKPNRLLFSLIRTLFLRCGVGFQALMVISQTATRIRWCKQVYIAAGAVS